MKILNMPLGSGKTTALVKMMLEPGNEDVVFVAPTKSQAEAIGYRTATTTLGQPESKELRSRFISAAELPNRKGRKERYVIDEIDGVIGGLIGGEVVAIAGTDEDEKKAYRENPEKYWERNTRREVKADSKGRLTGAQPETQYVKREAADGTIIYEPVAPKVFDVYRDVTFDQFEEFFGVSPSDVRAQDVKVHYLYDNGDYLHNSLVVKTFIRNEDGSKVRDEHNNLAEQRVLIRIKKDSE